MNPSNSPCRRINGLFVRWWNSETHWGDHGFVPSRVNDFPLGPVSVTGQHALIVFSNGNLRVSEGERSVAGFTSRRWRWMEEARRREHLYLTVIADSFDGDGGSQRTVGVPGRQLYNALGSAHQASHGAAVLQELLLLILRPPNKQLICQRNTHTETHTYVCVQIQCHIPIHVY